MILQLYLNEADPQLAFVLLTTCICLSLSRSIDRNISYLSVQAQMISLSFDSLSLTIFYKDGSVQ